MLGASLGWAAYRTLRKLRLTGRTNLALAFPEKGSAEREIILKKMYRNLGWQLAEFCSMSAYRVEQASEFIRYEGLEHYLQARAKGKGVLILTGHLGAWELSSFYHSLRGYPMSMVIRRLDNDLVDSFVNGIRCLHGNHVIHKSDFARGLLQAMHQGESVGILMDTNMTPPQGVFVPFFGVDACTATAMARIALKTDAAVLPGFLLWEEREKKYVLHFGEEIELVRGGNAHVDVIDNTARFTVTLEAYIRRYPDQWLWVHRRWKTRPEGGAKIYS
jgi:KDO2-lipid IV(A) lauroyltransferase